MAGDNTIVHLTEIVDDKEKTEEEAKLHNFFGGPSDCYCEPEVYRGFHPYTNEPVIFVAHQHLTLKLKKQGA